MLQFDRTGGGDVQASDLSHRYLWGPAVDQILADETVGDGGSDDVLWPLVDHQGTVRDLAFYDEADGETTIANHVAYNAFGRKTSETNAAVDCVFAYTGRLLDDDTGLQNHLHRWYDPETAKWLSEDPIGFEAGDANLSRWVGNGGTTGVDPDGLQGTALASQKQAFAARDAALRESTWNLFNPRSDGFLLSYMASAVWHAFPTATEASTEICTDAMDRAAERYSSAEDTLWNRSLYGVEWNAYYLGATLSHAGINLGKVGMAGWTAACTGPVAPALMESTVVHDLGYAVLIYGTYDQTREIALDLSQGNLPKPENLANLTWLRYGWSEVLPQSTAPAPGRAVTNLQRVSAADANAPFVAKGWGAPYANTVQARTFTTGTDMQFVRVHGAGNQQGAFVVRAEEIAGMTPAQIQQHLALPRVPTHISDVYVPATTRMQMGRVGAQPGFGVPNPGGIQYQLLDTIPGSSFQNMRPLP